MRARTITSGLATLALAAATAVGIVTVASPATANPNWPCDWSIQGHEQTPYWMYNNCSATAYAKLVTKFYGAQPREWCVRPGNAWNMGLVKDVEYHETLGYHDNYPCR